MVKFQFLRWQLGIVGAVAALQALCLAQSPSSPPRVFGLSHVAVKATEYEKSVAFYRDFLGFAEQGRLFYPANGRRELVFLKVSDTQTIEVFDAANVTQTAGQLYQIALNVEDAEAVRVHLARHGIRVPPVVPRGQMKNANFTTRDPNGYILEIVQYLPEGRMVVDRGKFLSPTRISDHIIAAGVSTENLSETLKFYKGLWGFTEMADEHTAGHSPSARRLQIPNSSDYLEISISPAHSAPYFCLSVADIDVAKARLEGSAYRGLYSKPVQITTSSNGQRVMRLFDPDGIRIEVLETKRISTMPK